MGAYCTVLLHVTSSTRCASVPDLPRLCPGRCRGRSVLINPIKLSVLKRVTSTGTPFVPPLCPNSPSHYARRNGIACCIQLTTVLSPHIQTPTYQSVIRQLFRMSEQTHASMLVKSRMQCLSERSLFLFRPIVCANIFPSLTQAVLTLDL